MTQTQVDVHGRKSAWSFIRMSSAGKCRRQIGYEALGIAESDPTPVEGRNVMEMGDAAELVLVHRLREEGWEVDLSRWEGGEQMEVRLDGPPRVGHPDGRCRHPELTRNLWVLLECKGMNAYQYHRFLKEGFLKSHPQYLDQVAHYSTALHDMRLVADANAAVVAALDRDTGKWGYQRVRWESEVYRGHTEALLAAWRTIESGQLPDRDYEGTTWQCNPRFCRWSTLCWGSLRPCGNGEQQAEGRISAHDLPEAGDLLAAIASWRDGKEMEAGGKAMIEVARDLFQQVLARHGAKTLTGDGLAATLVGSERRSWDEKVLRRLLTEAQLREAQRVMPTISLRVTDTDDRSDN